MTEKYYNARYNPETNQNDVFLLTEKEVQHMKNCNIVFEHALLKGESGCTTKENYTDEEIQEYKNKITDLKWAKMRERRNQLLTESDFMMLPDLWAGYNNSEKNIISQYRQALRDLPTTITDIDNVIYPEKP